MDCIFTKLPFVFQLERDPVSAVAVTTKTPTENLSLPGTSAAVSETGTIGTGNTNCMQECVCFTYSINLSSNSLFGLRLFANERCNSSL